MTEEYPRIEEEEEEIIVRCSNSSCQDTCTFDSDITAETGTLGESDWEARFSIDENGTVTIVEVYCPDHRLVDTIDELEETMIRVTEGAQKAVSAAEEVVNDSD